MPGQSAKLLPSSYDEFSMGFKRLVGGAVVKLSVSFSNLPVRLQVKRILDRKPLAPDGPRDPFKGATITWWRFNISRDAASNGFHFMPLQFTLPVAYVTYILHVGFR